MKKTGLGTKISMLLCILTLLCACVALASCGGGIELDVTEKTLYFGDSFKITATTANEEALIEWTSSDDSVASVRRGTVTAKAKEGTATITATTDAGDEATCVVTVKSRTITISQETATIDLSQTDTLTLTATSSVEGDEIEWYSSDSSLAVVDGGVVTAYDVGTVTVTASKGSIEASCIIDIIDPNRPADYRALAQGKNAEVVANPGVWYYWADGTGYTYAAGGKPTYQDGGVQVTITEASAGGSQFFRFRYQPGGLDGTGVQVGEAYTISYTLTMNTDGKVGGNKPTTLTANEPKQITYSGSVLEGEGFQISIKNDVEIPAGGLSLRVSNITVTAGATVGGGDYTDEGELELGKNAVVKATPGVWFYNSSDQAEFTAAPNRDANGTLTVTASTWGADMFYFRYQPDAAKDGVAVGDAFRVTFTVKLSVAGQVSYKYDGAMAQSITEELEADVEETLSFETEMTATSGPLWIAVPQTTEAGATLTISNIIIEKITEGEEPTPDGGAEA